MKPGLDTLQGASDTTRCIVETVLTGKVPQRQTQKSSVRTTLKQSFSGSYGQRFSIEIHDEGALDRFEQIGMGVLLELISYFLNDSVYREPRKLSPGAQDVIDNLGEAVNKLAQQLRKSPLRNIHEVPVKLGYSVKIRFRKNKIEQTELAEFNQASAQSILAKLSLKSVVLQASITRLNINTGNGRLVPVDGYETIAFGFDRIYARVDPEMKVAVSENLNYNNGREPEKWKYIDVVARPLELPDGRVVKYIIKELRV
ncbi:hypothetical protein [Burkholderia cenocepacia]|uniref:hypothetical protein n=1 Tax=Burkholderia cenocepacia TaxID=95486 RepID=UPI00201167B2|nr:hypothetical protein [Burkholderia cenocepacia]